MHLFLVRHGQSEANRGRRERDGDAPLTDAGRRQVDLLSGWIAPRLAPASLYASTLRRCAETAERLGGALGLVPRFDHRLREVGNCKPDGTPHVNPRFEPFIASTRPYEPPCQGGENWVEFRGRVAAFVDDVLREHGEDEQVLLVCHSGVIEAVSDHAFGIGAPRRAELSIFNSAVTHWEHRPGDPEPWLLHGHNLVYHLEGAARDECLLSSAPIPYRLLSSH